MAAAAGPEAADAFYWSRAVLSEGAAVRCEDRAAGKKVRRAIVLLSNLLCQ
jgi:hypothetical protein